MGFRQGLNAYLWAHVPLILLHRSMGVATAPCLNHYGSLRDQQCFEGNDLSLASKELVVKFIRGGLFLAHVIFW